MTKVREHRGSLSNSMGTVFEVEDFNGLLDAISKSMFPIGSPFGVKLSPGRVHVEHYTYDDRIGWDTYIVSIDGYGVWGFTDGPL